MAGFDDILSEFSKPVQAEKPFSIDQESSGSLKNTISLIQTLQGMQAEKDRKALLNEMSRLKIEQERAKLPENILAERQKLDIVSDPMGYADKFAKANGYDSYLSAPLNVQQQAFDFGKEMLGKKDPQSLAAFLTAVPLPKAGKKKAEDGQLFRQLTGDVAAGAVKGAVSGAGSLVGLAELAASNIYGESTFLNNVANSIQSGADWIGNKLQSDQTIKTRNEVNRGMAMANLAGVDVAFEALKNNPAFMAQFLFEQGAQYYLPAGAIGAVGKGAASLAKGTTAGLQAAEFTGALSSKIFEWAATAAKNGNLAEKAAANTIGFVASRSAMSAKNGLIEAGSSVTESTEKAQKYLESQGISKDSEEGKAYILRAQNNAAGYAGVVGATFGMFAPGLEGVLSKVATKAGRQALSNSAAGGGVIGGAAKTIGGTLKTAASEGLEEYAVSPKTEYGLAKAKGINPTYGQIWDMGNPVEALMGAVGGAGTYAGGRAVSAFSGKKDSASTDAPRADQTSASDELKNTTIPNRVNELMVDLLKTKDGNNIILAEIDRMPGEARQAFASKAVRDMAKQVATELDVAVTENTKTLQDRKDVFNSIRANIEDQFIKAAAIDNPQFRNQLAELATTGFEFSLTEGGTIQKVKDQATSRPILTAAQEVMSEVFANSGDQNTDIPYSQVRTPEFAQSLIEQIKQRVKDNFAAEAVAPTESKQSATESDSYNQTINGYREYFSSDAIFTSQNERVSRASSDLDSLLKAQTKRELTPVESGKKRALIDVLSNEVKQEGDLDAATLGAMIASVNKSFTRGERVTSAQILQISNMQKILAQKEREIAESIQDEAEKQAAIKSSQDALDAATKAEEAAKKGDMEAAKAALKIELESKEKAEIDSQIDAILKEGGEFAASSITPETKAQYAKTYITNAMFKHLMDNKDLVRYDKLTVLKSILESGGAKKSKEQKQTVNEEGVGDKTAAPKPQVITPEQALKELSRRQKQKTSLTKNSEPSSIQAASNNAAQSTALNVNTFETPEVKAERVRQQKIRSDRAARLRNMTFNKSPFLAFLGNYGIAYKEKREFSPDKNPMLSGYGIIFRRNGRPLDALVDNAIQDGFLPKDATESDLRDLISSQIGNLTRNIQPLYGQDGDAAMQTMFEQKNQAEYEDYLAAQRDQDPFVLSDEDLTDTGFSELDIESQKRVSAFIQYAESLGIDAESIATEVSMRNEAATQQDYENEATSAIQAAIDEANSQRQRESGRGQDSGTAGNAGEQAIIAEEGLTRPTPESLRDADNRAKQANKADREEQARLEQQERKATERKEIANRSQAAADTFELGGNAEDNLSGQNVLFSKAAKEEPKDLIVTHNLTADNLAFAMRMGGLAAPSLAVSKMGDAITSFGEITLIGDRDLVDPKGYAKTKVFGADIYSPRYPEISYKLSKQAIDKINIILQPFNENGEGRIYPEQIRKPKDLSNFQQFIAYAKSRNVDKDTAATALLQSVGADEQLFQGFSYSGNRKYKPHTLDNVIKELKKELRSGESFNYGMGSVRANFTPQFKSIAQIKKESSRLVSKEDFETIKKEMDDALMVVANDLRPYHPASSDFGYLDTVTSALSDMAKMSQTKALKENGFNPVPQQAMVNLNALIGKLANLPAEYFEAKILRGVDISEFRAAVVSDKATSETIDLLNSRGLTVTKYKHGDEQNRKAAVQNAAQSQNLVFSLGSGTTTNTAAKAQAEIERIIGKDGYKRLIDGGKFSLLNSSQTAEIERLMNGGAQKSIIAYHGSPYRFDKFSLDHLGKGEGAQAYGWGLYFSESLEVANYYRKVLGRQIWSVTENGGDSWVAKWISAPSGKQQNKSMRSFDSKKEAEDYAAQKEIETNNSRTYRVNIKPDEETFLLWDKPLSEQPKKVKDAISKISLWLPKTKRPSNADTGEQINQLLIDRYGKAKDAATQLNAAGINGIKYLDGNSRGDKKGSYNYVVFDDAAVEIVETYYSKDNENTQAFYNPKTGDIVLIADRISEGKTWGVLLHEIGHKSLEQAIGKLGMTRLRNAIDAWKDAPSGSNERVVYDAAVKRAMTAAGGKAGGLLNSLPDGFDKKAYDAFIKAGQYGYVKKSISNLIKAGLLTEQQRETAKQLALEINQKRADRKNQKPTWRSQIVGRPMASLKAMANDRREVAKIRSKGAAKDWSNEGISDYLMYESRSDKNAIGRAETVKTIERLAEDRGYTIADVSERGGGYSIYLEKDGRRIRVSDHDLPDTAQREYNRSQGYTGKWDDEVVTGSWAFYTIDDYFHRIENGSFKDEEIYESKNTSDLNATGSFNPKVYEDEIIPYAIEEAANLGIDIDSKAPAGTVAKWLASVRDMFSRALAKLFKGNAPKLTTNDLLDIARGAAGLEIEGKPIDAQAGGQTISTSQAPFDGVKKSISSQDVNKANKRIYEARSSNAAERLKAAAIEATPDYLRGGALNLKKTLINFIDLRSVAYAWRDLFMVGGKNILQTAVDLANERGGKIRAALVDIDTKAVFNGKSIIKLYQDNQGASQLWQVMDSATVLQYDPSSKLPSGQDEISVRDAYNSLNDEQKAIYKATLSKFKDQWTRTIAALKTQIKDSGVDESTANKLIGSLNEKGLDVYFAQQRFGNYVNIVKSSKGETLWFSRHESNAEAERINQKLKLEYPQDKVSTGIFKDITSSQIDGATQGYISSFLSSLKTKQGYSEDQAKMIESLMNEVLAKTKINKTNANLQRRKNIAGASQDAYRSNVSAMRNGEQRIGMLEFQTKVNKAVQAVRDHAEDEAGLMSNDDKKTAQIVAQYVADTVNYQQKDGLINTIANGATTYGFVHTMWANISTALINATSLLTVAAPTLGARFGYANASAKMLNASVDVSAFWAKALANLPKNRLATNKELVDIAKENGKDFGDVFEYAQKIGMLQYGDAREIYDIVNSTSKASRYMNTAIRAGAFPMEKSEEFTNLTILLSAYRAGIERGLSKQDALEQARDLRYQINPDNSSDNKSLAARTPVGRVAMQLKSYGIAMTTMMYADLKYAINAAYAAKNGGTITQEQKIAMKRLSGVIGMHALVSGLAGVPFLIATPMLALAWAVSGGLDDEEDLPMADFLKNRISAAYGESAMRALFSGLLGEGVSGRISLDNLLLDTRNNGSPSKEVDDTVRKLLGPSVGGLWNGARNINVYFAGEKTAMETISSSVPAAAGNVLKAYNFYEEDGMAYGRAGNPLLKEGLSNSEMLAQMIGIRPAELAYAREKESAIKEQSRQSDAKRRMVMALYKDIILLSSQNKDTEGAIEIYNLAKSVYNRQYPQFMIDEKTEKSAKNRALKARDEYLVSLSDNKEASIAGRLKWAFSE